MPASIAQLEEHRAALTGHCYRMLGSAVDADDAHWLEPIADARAVGPGTPCRGSRLVPTPPMIRSASPSPTKKGARP